MQPDDKTEQAQIQATDDLMVEQTFVVGPVTSWLSHFLVWSTDNPEYRCQYMLSLARLRENAIHASCETSRCPYREAKRSIVHLF